MASPTVTQLVATTLLNYHKELADNVSNTNALTALLRKGNRIRVIDGGRAIACPLAYDEETFAWYTGLDPLSRAVKETISEADYAPAQCAASITISGSDQAMNRGPQRILNLVESKIQNAEATLGNNITKAVYGDGSVAKSFPGLKAFITDDGLGTVGGINATTWAMWKNKFISISGQTGSKPPLFVDMKYGLNQLWLQLIRGSEKPDLIPLAGNLYSAYESGLQDLQRFSDATLAGLGFETIKYKTANIVYDGTATGLTGGYMLNTKYFKLEVYSGRNFEPLDLPESTPDMDGLTRHLAFMGGLTLSNRAMQGRIIYVNVP